MKTCITCKNVYPKTLEYFYKQGKYLRSYCKSCDKLLRMSNINKNRTKHLNRLKEYNKKYHAENPNKAREKRRKRRALIKNNNHQSYTEEQVLEVYGTNCYLCDMPIDLNNSRRIGISGWKTGLHIEHLIPLSNNGSDSIDNVRPSHGWCNISKGAKSV